MVVHTYANGLTIDSTRRYYLRLPDVPRERFMPTLLCHKRGVPSRNETYFGSDSYAVSRNPGEEDFIYDKMNRYIESSAAVYFEFANDLGEFYLRHNNGSYLSVTPESGKAFFDQDNNFDKSLLRIAVLDTKPLTVLIKLADGTNRFLTHERSTMDKEQKFWNFSAVFRYPQIVTEGGDYADGRNMDTQFAIRLYTVFMGP